MNKITEQINTMLGNNIIQWETDDFLFTKMADFIIDLDPNILTNIQIEKVMDIIELLEVEDDTKISELKLAGKSSSDKKKYSRIYYRKNRNKIKKVKKIFKKSSEGRKRKRNKIRLSKLNRTPTGKRKVKYRRRVVS